MKILCGTLLYLFLCSSILHAKIIETKEIAKVLPYTVDNSVVFFNVTDTLYEPACTLGDHQWRLYFSRIVTKIVPSLPMAATFSNKIKSLIVNQIPKKAVDAYTPRLITDLQKELKPVFGITKKSISTPYADNYGEITYKHLLSIGIDLEKTLAYSPVSPTQENNSHMFSYGIVFTNKQPVGPAVVSFVKRLKTAPRKIVMVDDSEESLINVETALKPLGINFVGVCYSRCHGRHSSFDPDLGTIQFFEYLKSGRVLSDEEAKQVKFSHPEIQYQSLLEDFIRLNAEKA